MNSATFTIDVRDSDAMPETPWPDVQPFPIRVPIPTRIPAEQPPPLHLGDEGVGGEPELVDGRAGDDTNREDDPPVARRDVLLALEPREVGDIRQRRLEERTVSGEDSRPQGR